ncbi:MAG TPA: glycosyl transferase [Marinobacter adhaerens]|nr:glycosyltransferase [Marinobacter sp.]MAK48883.1 glycosyl transferase [Marinobacter sp.]HAP51949.1 glycosyl transferase [Marinobacter adhaerens]HBI78094.1 glycosyl transferase [Marinobacter adhaerens]HCA12049.1 glycosyl transferase [Marinobacter adhaerens]
MVVISVITPTYNRARFLPAAVASVLSQTFGDFELIIVDDGSEDNTPDVLKPFLADRRVRYVYQENQGQSHARNLALKQATGDFIAFLDSDDVWARDKLEKQLAVFRANSEVDIVHGDEATINEQGSVVSLQNMRRYSGRITRYLLADNSVSITTALVRRRCFDEMGGFDTSVGVADDYELWLRFSARYCYQYEPGIVASYRVMADQISSDKRRRYAANERIIQQFLARYGEVLSPGERRWGLARFYCRKARYFASAGERGKAVGAIAGALHNAPLDSVVWRALYRVAVPRR